MASNTINTKFFLTIAFSVLLILVTPTIITTVIYWFIGSDFSNRAKSDADRLLGIANYCIIAPHKRSEAAYFITNFKHVNLKEVIKQAVYFKLYLPSQEVRSGLASARKRNYHFAIYNSDAMYYWSLREDRFIKSPDYVYVAFQQILKVYSMYKGRPDILGKGGFSQPSWDYYDCPH
ncbi:hypothetical protein [Microbulbifer sp. PSTR4-B]|uniref:hypothetical protein n=1 Tax=Microbulbifer sp. PSTR4-B TaxID=3243396 RepID=UPI00403980EB